MAAMREGLALRCRRLRVRTGSVMPADADVDAGISARAERISAAVPSIDPSRRAA
jgi:hypothetical protein